MLAISPLYSLLEFGIGKFNKDVIFTDAGELFKGAFADEVLVTEAGETERDVFTDELMFTDDSEILIGECMLTGAGEAEIANIDEG